MSTITKKQTALALVAVVFATAMIASIAASADQSAFAKHRHHYSGSNGGNHITVASEQSQSANVQTAGGTSPITGSGNNAQSSTNSNTGGIISN